MRVPMPDDEEYVPEPARWQRATVDMIEAVEVEKLFDGATSVHAYELGRILYDNLKIIPENEVGRPLLEMLA